MKKLKLTAIYYPQVSGGYTVICPELGLTTQGETMMESQSMLSDIIDDYFKNDKIMDIDDYVEGFNTGHKIITELDYEYAETNSWHI